MYISLIVILRSLKNIKNYLKRFMNNHLVGEYSKFFMHNIKKKLLKGNFLDFVQI